MALLLKATVNVEYAGVDEAMDWVLTDRTG
jgi:hypothetical protein